MGHNVRTSVLLVTVLLLFANVASTTNTTKCLRCGLLATLPLCTLKTFAGTVCKIHIDSIHPTQFGAGPGEVRATLRLGDDYMDRGIYEDYLTMYNIPIVIGLDHFYLTDKHHHVFGIEQSKKVARSDKWVSALIAENKQKDDEETFWIYMVNKNYVWLYDANGKGPLDPMFLPSTISDLTADPFRDLAYQLRVNRMVIPTSMNYVEFMWANYLRKFIPFPQKANLTESEKVVCKIRPYSLKCSEPGFKRSEWLLSEEVKKLSGYLAQHEEASYLPGFKRAVYFDSLTPVL